MNPLDAAILELKEGKKVSEISMDGMEKELLAHAKKGENEIGFIVDLDTKKIISRALGSKNAVSNPFHIDKPLSLLRAAMYHSHSSVQQFSPKDWHDFLTYDYLLYSTVYDPQNKYTLTKPKRMSVKIDEKEFNAEFNDLKKKSGYLKAIVAFGDVLCKRHGITFSKESRVKTKEITESFAELVEANPYRDKQGRFSSKGNHIASIYPEPSRRKENIEFKIDAMLRKQRGIEGKKIHGLKIYHTESELPPVKEGFIRVAHGTDISALKGIDEKGVLSGNELHGKQWGHGGVNAIVGHYSKGFGDLEKGGVTVFADVPFESLSANDQKLTKVDQGVLYLPKIESKNIVGVFSPFYRVPSTGLPIDMIPGTWDTISKWQDEFYKKYPHKKDIKESATDVIADLILEESESYTVPESVRAAAKRGLELRKKHGRGGLDAKQASKEGVGSGVVRASNLMNGNKVSLATVKRMAAYFSRHQGDKSGKDWNNAESPSAGKIAWLLWGGDVGWSWAKKILKQTEVKESSEFQESAEKCHPELWKKCVAAAKALEKGGGKGNWSAWKAGQAVAMYKAKGGKFKGKKPAKMMQEANKNHEPAGTPKGGQFAPSKTSLASSAFKDSIETKSRVRVTDKDGKEYTGIVTHHFPTIHDKNETIEGYVSIKNEAQDSLDIIPVKDIAEAHVIGKKKSTNPVDHVDMVAGGGISSPDDAKLILESGEGKAVREKLQESMKGKMTETEYSEKETELQKKLDEALSAYNSSARHSSEAIDALDLIDKINIDENKLRKEIDGVRKESKERLMELLEPVKPETFVTHYVSEKDNEEADKYFSATLKEGEAWYNRVVDSPIADYGHSKMVSVIEKKDSVRRSHYEAANFDDDYSVIYLDNKKASVLVHEFGHHLENTVPGLREAAVSFLSDRIKGYEFEKIADITGNPGYGGGELAVKDNFKNTYFGKLYIDKNEKVYATEIVSQGLEGLYKNPLSLAEKEPEVFDFVVNALRLKRLREEKKPK